MELERRLEAAEAELADRRTAEGEENRQLALELEREKGRLAGEREGGRR